MKACSKCGFTLSSSMVSCFRCGEPVPDVQAAPTFSKVMDTTSFVVPAGKRLVWTWALAAGLALAAVAAAGLMAR